MDFIFQKPRVHDFEYTLMDYIHFYLITNHRSYGHTISSFSNSAYIQDDQLGGASYL